LNAPEDQIIQAGNFPLRIWKKVQHEKVAPNQYIFNIILFGTFRQVVWK
jgi:hypothetical protein